MTIALAIAALAAVAGFAGTAVHLALKLGALRGTHQIGQAQLQGVSREYAAYRIAAEQQVAELKEIADDLVDALGDAADPRVVAAALSLRERASLQTARDRAATLFAERTTAANAGATAGLSERSGLLGRLSGGGGRDVPDPELRVDADGGDVPPAGD